MHIFSYSANVSYQELTNIYFINLKTLSPLFLLCPLNSALIKIRIFRIWEPQMRNLLRFYLCLYFCNNSFIEIQFTYHKIYPFKLYNWLLFVYTIYTVELCNRHHYLIPELVLVVTSHSPLSQPLLSLSHWTCLFWTFIY